MAGDGLWDPSPPKKNGLKQGQRIAGWWQLKDFWNFHPEPCGDDPI